ncbi:MAG: Gfo/Idh/MocA family oxidoreductase [Deltaproteobacteria bacterium]|nr:Gfo/Idh/MocA family oxidoreductase [Deltaproteobacteria bacterium]
MVSIGQLGVGYWGPNLLRNLNSDPSFRVVAACDLSAERRSYVERHFPDIAVESDAEALISNPAIEALVIATPAGTHFELARRALQSGKHVLVEKPMASTSAEVQELGRLAESKGLVAMVGHTFIYNSAVQYLRKMVEDGTLGEVRYIYCQRLNLGRIRSDVDALWNFGPHDISIVQYILGNSEPLSVAYHGMDYVQPGIDDVVFLNLVYPGKVLVNIHVSWLDPSRKRSIVVVGSEKMVVYDDVSEHKITIFDKGIDRRAELGKHMDYDARQPLTFDYRSGDVWIPKINFTEPLKGEVRHFYECVANGAECLTGPAHALKVIDVLERAGAARNAIGPVHKTSPLRGAIIKERVEEEHEAPIPDGSAERAMKGARKAKKSRAKVGSS